MSPDGNCRGQPLRLLQWMRPSRQRLAAIPSALDIFITGTPLHTLADEIECSPRRAIDVNQSRHNPNTVLREISSAVDLTNGKIRPRCKNMPSKLNYCFVGSRLMLIKTDTSQRTELRVFRSKMAGPCTASIRTSALHNLDMKFRLPYSVQGELV
jgi:hypothetical protein